MRQRIFSQGCALTGAYKDHRLLSGKGKSFERGREAYHRRAVRIYQKTRIPDGLQSVGGGV